MELSFSKFNKGQKCEYNTWQEKEQAQGLNGLNKFVVLQDSLLGDYLEFVDQEIDDTTIESIYIGDNLVGFIGYSMQNDKHLHVEILGINPEFRGKGIASKLLKAFKEKMQNEKSIERFTLSVKKDNESGIASFSKVGKEAKNQDKENYINFEL